MAMDTKRMPRGLVSITIGLPRAGGVDAIQQGLIANQLAELLNIGPDQVHRLFAQAARPRRSESGDPPSGSAYSAQKPSVNGRS